MKYVPDRIIGSPFESLELVENKDYIIDDNQEYDSSDKGWYVTACDQTWEMELDENKAIRLILIGSKLFSLLNIKLNANRDYIKLKYGNPKKNGNASLYTGLAEVNWDQYEIGNIIYHFEYEVPLMNLRLIAFIDSC